MKHSVLRTLILLSAVGLGSHALRADQSDQDKETFNQAKILMFEQKWEEAHRVFQQIIREFPRSALLPQVYFHSAHCLRLQNKPEEAVVSYDQFLKKYPAEPFISDEARQAIVELAAALFEQGKMSYKNRLVSALSDSRKEVRYLAAIRSSSLKDLQLHSLSVPVLKEIIANEKQRELVNLASISLLKIDPKALARTEPNKSSGSARISGSSEGRMFHLEIYEGDERGKPKVELAFPFGLAQLAVKALTDGAKAEIRKKGIDVDNIWEGLKKLGAKDVLTIRDGKNIIKIWIQ